MFHNNPNLPRADYQHAYTQHEIDEFRKCAEDPIYFAKNYIKIVNVDHGLMPFSMWPFQEEMVSNFHENRFSINLCPRQVGKTSCAVAFLLHYVLFNKDVNIAILANKAATAQEIMSRLQLAFEYLPMFLKSGVVVWNKRFIELSNGSKALADSTSGSSIRGRSFNIIFLDEFAFVPNNIAEAFFSSVYPTISSGETTKVIIVSTPNGLNMFYRMWKDATEKRSTYSPFSVHWSQVPGRTEEWKEETIRNTSEQQFRQEFDCEFIGSTNTLINPIKLRALTFERVLRSEGLLDVYEDPKEGRVYCVCVDVSEGLNLDYSAFSILDITEIPYRQVAKYRNNQIPPLTYPTVIYSAAKRWNEAFVLVEINTIGLQVADILQYDLGYENLIKVTMKGRQGQQQTGGHVKTRIAFGLKQSEQTKKIGCANLKTLIESDKLIVTDAQTIMELTTFSQDKKTFKAEEGNHDDLVMGLVNFGWLTSQKFFRDGMKEDIRRHLVAEQLRIEEDDWMPMPHIESDFQRGNQYNKDKYQISGDDLWVDATEPYDWRGRPR